jgi:hypothetical protein
MPELFGLLIVPKSYPSNCNPPHPRPIGYPFEPDKNYLPGGFTNLQAGNPGKIMPKLSRSSGSTWERSFGGSAANLPIGRASGTPSLNLGARVEFRLPLLLVFFQQRLILVIWSAGIED